MVIHGDLATAAWAHCTITGRALQEVTSDLVILDEDGRPLLSVEGVVLSGSRRNLARSYATDAALSQWLYGVSWQAAEPPAPSSENSRGLTMIYGLETAFTRSLTEILAQQGRRFVRVRPASGFRPLGDDTFEVDPASADDVRRVLAAFPAQPWADIIHLLAADLRFDESPTATAAVLGPGSVATLIQAIEKSGLGGRPRLTVVTCGANAVTADEGGDPLQAMVWGFCRAVVFEHPNLKTRRIDVDSAALPASNAAVLAVEILGGGDESQVAYRLGKRFVERLIRREAKSRRHFEIRPDAAYLITGGWGALGLTAMETLLRMGATRIVLAGRSEPGTYAESVISRMRAEGKEIRIERCDVTDPAQVRSLIASFPEGPGRLCGIVHAAGRLDDGAIMNLSLSRLTTVLGPKLEGAYWLHHAAAGLKLDFFVLYSSAASMFGAPGQGNYCSANAFLDGLARYRNHSGLPGLAIGWGAWAGGGMVEAQGGDIYSSRLVDLIPHDIGGNLFEHLLVTEQDHLAILPFSVPALIQFYPSNAGLEYFREIVGDDLRDVRSDGGVEKLHVRPSLNTPYVAPETVIQAALVSIWERSLRISGIGMRDDIFELGGDSVFAGQILSAVNENYGVTLRAEDAFEAFTIEQLANLIEKELMRIVAALDDAQIDTLLAES